MTTRSRIALIVAAVVVVAAAGVIASSLGGDDASKSVTAAVVTVKDGKPVGGVKEFTFKKGGTIDLTVHSDVADEVHFHGYDVHKDVTAGGTVRFVMRAKFDGEFEVELEDAKQQLATIIVR